MINIAPVFCVFFFSKSAQNWGIMLIFFLSLPPLPPTSLSSRKINMINIFPVLAAREMLIVSMSSLMLVYLTGSIVWMCLGKKKE